MMINLFFRWYILFVMILASGQSYAAVNPMWVTIYVHGTTTAVGLKFLGKFCKDVSFGAPGIHHVNCLPDNALLHQDIELLQQRDPIRFCSEHFYTFGWSGKLNFAARAHDGKILYKELIKLLEHYKTKYGYYPHVRLMTFSHGGNVALNMVKHLPFCRNEHIHLELLLIACPVQKTTEHLIEHAEIDQVYVISSSRDLLQVVDYYYHDDHGYFPDRFFHTKKSNCTQVKVEINNRGLGHIDLMRSFMIHLPYVLNFADVCMQDRCVVEEDMNLCNPFVIDCSIVDKDFRFFNGLNLVPVVRGQRKK